ncbi:DUF1501 domain-containing protein [Portibacter lacus]|uniref:Sulfatase n=1 Tax=Portibacter lacus TaxID=1099794 RepID=A0AA37SJU4_9BACT|nr:DUF1501 domain-containing protein [Portibacter lacus]GLR15871.1 sulfatase [Portibacter lacus]
MKYNIEKLWREHSLKNAELNSRRVFLKNAGISLGALALGSFLPGCKTPGMQEKALDLNPLMPKSPHFAAKAKSVIYIHMAGAPSQFELFDFKPELNKLNGMDCPPSLLAGKKFAFIRGIPKMLGNQAQFEQVGDSGAWVSENLPHFKKVVDEVSFLRGIHTDQFNHAPAQIMMHSGSAIIGRPSLGSWATYGLGSENQNLPGFVVLTSGGVNPDAGKQVWGSGFLPSVYQGVQCRSSGDPVLFLNNPENTTRDIRKLSINAINDVNKLTYDEFKDPETVSRISQYEMAFRMQMSVPEVMDISSEPESIHKLYGTEPGKESFANNALLARKLVEKGVRFVQLFDWGWDAHGVSRDTSLGIGLKNKCRETDKPVAALLLDLKQRGLLDETLVIWGGEFGRTPMQENRNGVSQVYAGRDHHPNAFTMWMAGGGIKQGESHGETDEIGYEPTRDKKSIHDIHATILNQLGFDHEQFTHEFQGRRFRLTDVEGRVIKSIIT